VKSLQNIFDEVITHLVRQGKRAAAGGHCRYRADGLKCAVGVLIPDEEYDSAWEGCPVGEIHYMLGRPESFWGIDVSHLRFLVDLQDLHDRVHHWKEGGLSVAGKRRVQRLAEIWGLKVPTSLEHQDKPSPQ